VKNEPNVEGVDCEIWGTRVEFDIAWDKKKGRKE